MFRAATFPDKRHTPCDFSVTPAGDGVLSLGLVFQGPRGCVTLDPNGMCVDLAMGFSMILSLFFR